MDVVRLTAQLVFLRFPVGHVYLWLDPAGITVIDAGLPGSGPAIAQAIRSCDRAPEQVRQLILTHAHRDHVGSAAEIASWGPVTVVAHRADAAVARGLEEPPAPVLAGWERALWDRVHAGIPEVPVQPVRVDCEVLDGDTLDLGRGAHVLAVPGHTPGSLAVHLPAERVLFTGDTIARGPDGTVMLGVFNADPAAAVASLRRQATLDVGIACFGHGEPVVGEASLALRTAATARPR